MRHDALDSWRGLCALCVALFHFPVLGVLHEARFIRHSYLFVDFFFVLSGFIIATVQARRPDGLWVFILKRFGRIWPLHVAMLALFVAVSVVQGDLGADERHSVGAIWTNLFMVHAWGVHRDLTWNDPSWSISVEWLLYLIFAGLTFLPWRRFVYAALVAAGIGALFFFAPNGMGSTFDFGVARGLAGFFLGALIARAQPRPFGTVAEVAAVAAMAAFVASGVAPYIAPFVFGAAVYVFMGSKGLVKRALEVKPLVWLGERSYSLYMLHAALVAVVWVVGPMLGMVQQGPYLASAAGLMWAAAAAYLVVLIGASAVSYRLLEKPARSYFNRLALAGGVTEPAARTS